MDNTPFESGSLFLRSSEYTTSINNKSNLLFELNTPIISQANMNIMMALQSFKFTNSFYSINENNCNFYYSIDNINYKFVVKLGNYNIDTLIDYLNINIPILKFSYDQSTLKVNISSVTVFSIIIGPNNILEVLGYSDINDSLNNTYYSKLSHDAPYCLNMMGVQLLHICVPNISLKSVGVKNRRNYNILDSIHVSCLPGETQTYINNSNFRYKISDVDITFVNIVILDQDFNIVEFNNIDWFLKLSFEFTYKNQLIRPDTLEPRNNDMQKYILEEEQRNLNRRIDNLIANK
jgi:hypothetical protein